MVSDDVFRLMTLCAVRVDGKSIDWSLIARAAGAGDLDVLYAGRVPDREPPAIRARAEPVLRQGLTDLKAARDRVEQELAAADQVGSWLVTVLDDDYPANLTGVRDRPPFLFGQGDLREHDAVAVAVVGTRNVTDPGLRRAARFARELVNHDVTVVSGLARGVDTAAHIATLDAGGRTIAVLGTGITRCYPAENASLAKRIQSSGAVISQFWPTRTPGRDTFPRRNRVTSGISQGTVVIEASSTSGAKMQARLAYEHGKRVWLIASLVDQQDWARTMVDKGQAQIVSSSDEVVAQLTTTASTANIGQYELQLR